MYPEQRNSNNVTCGPLPHAEFHVYRGNVSPLRGENPIFGFLSKNNTGMAALRAGLTVKLRKCDITQQHIDI